MRGPAAIRFLLLAATFGPLDASAAAPQARFDWSAPARFVVPGLGADASPYEVYAESLHPESWPIDFDACASGDGVVEYRWAIDGTPAGSESHCDGFSWSFPSEGSYGVSLTVVDGEGAEATTTRTVLVQDLLIFGLGDSYGSGEGAPDQWVPAGAISLANAAQVAADSALAARDAAFGVYLAALSEYQITIAQLNALVAAVNRFQSAQNAVSANCPFPGVACAPATAELTAATGALLLELGRAGLAAIGIDQPFAILSAVSNLRALANAALDLAETSWEASQAALAAAQGELASARAQLVAGWQSRSCHRSSFSAQAQAARLLEERDPRTSVTFVHLACSGATIPKGILGPYAGIEPGAQDHPPQLDVVAALALVDPAQPELGPIRPVDAILLSIGGNDVNFAGIIEKCITHASCPDAPVLDAVALAARSAYCSTAPLWSRSECFAELAPPGFDTGLGAEDLFRSGLADLPASYAAIQTFLEESGLGGAAVHLTEYPDITRDESEALCGWHVTDDLETRQRNLLGFDSDEMAWAANVVFRELSGAMATTAGALGWRYVEGAAQRFRAHGYCSQQPWIVRLQQSFLVQAQPWGMVHPNAAGHAAWAEVIATAVPEPGAGAGTTAVLAALAALARRRRAVR
jgi:hypothetical protein